jgi:hypothetical protein
VRVPAIQTQNQGSRIVVTKIEGDGQHQHEQIFHPVAKFLVSNELEVGPLAAPIAGRSASPLPARDAQVCESSSLKALEILRKHQVRIAPLLQPLFTVGPMVSSSLKSCACGGVCSYGRQEVCACALSSCDGVSQFA